MPAASQQQQKLMALALAYKRGEVKDVSAKVKEIADSMSEKDLEDFASTKHKGLPMKKEELIKEGLSVLKENFTPKRTKGVVTSLDRLGVSNLPPSKSPQIDVDAVNRALAYNSPEASRDRSNRALNKDFQKTALGASLSPGGKLGNFALFGDRAIDAFDKDSRGSFSKINKYLDNAKRALRVPGMSDADFNREYGRIDTNTPNVLPDAMEFAKQKRLSQNLPRQSEDDIFGSFAGRKAKADAARQDYYKMGRGIQTNPTSSSVATTTPTTTAASQNFLKNIDPKLAAALAAGTLGTAGLAAFVANRRRKKKKR